MLSDIPNKSALKHRYTHLSTQSRTRATSTFDMSAQTFSTEDSKIPAMDTLIFVAPCIALMAPLFSPAISVLAVLALVFALAVVMTVLFFQAWNIGDPDENHAAAEDATDIIRVAPAALARAPGTNFCCFCVKYGVAVHSCARLALQKGAPKRKIRVETTEVGPPNHNTWGAGGRELASWSNRFHALNICCTRSSPRDGHKAVRRLRGFWVPVPSLDGRERLFQMV